MIPIQVKVGEGKVFYGVVAKGRYETSVAASMPVRVVNLATGQISEKSM